MKMRTKMKLRECGYALLGVFVSAPAYCAATFTIMPEKSKGHIAADGFALVIQKEDRQ